MDKGFVIGLPVGDSELLLCHGTACIIRMVRDLILPFDKSSIYSTKPFAVNNELQSAVDRNNSTKQPSVFTAVLFSSG